MGKNNQTANVGTKNFFVGSKIFLPLLLLIKSLILTSLYLYRGLISPLLGPRCRFYPSCSEYAIAAVQNHGIIRGLYLTGRRLLRCHPWHPGGVDLVPTRIKERYHS